MNERDIRILVKNGSLSNEFEFERALSADRKLRLLAKENPLLNTLRKELRGLIAQYEALHWRDEKSISEAQMEASDAAENLAEKESQFIEKRKTLIITRIKNLGLKQKDLGLLLKHSSSYTSELLNGIRAFSTNDLILIHRLFDIELKDLFFIMIPIETENRIKNTMPKISSKSVKLKGKGLQLINIGL